MKQTLLFTAFLVLAIGSVLAQEKGISVCGEGSIVAMPDRAVVTFCVSARDDKSLDALEEVNKLMKKVLEPLKVAGLDSKSITTSGYSIEPVFFREEKETHTEYIATSTIKVALGSANRVGDLLDKAFNGGAATLANPVYQLSQEEALKAQALDKAIQDAKNKAAKLAEAFGGAVGKPLHIDVSYDVQPLAANDGKADIYALATTSKSPILAPYQMVVSAKVNVNFELVGN